MITEVCLFWGWQSLAVLLHFLGGLDHLALYTFWLRRGRAGASGSLRGARVSVDESKGGRCETEDELWE